jgi:hypothetical protein
MQPVMIESSRVILLIQMTRPAGQPYLPEVAAKLAQRYSFQRLPSLDDLTSGMQTFSIGKFSDVQINDFQVYPDGVVVSARVDTDLLEAFLEDVLSWSKNEIGLMELPFLKSQTFFESAIVVKSDTDLAAGLVPALRVFTEAVNKATHGYRSEVPYQFTGLTFDQDPALPAGSRKLLRFGLERRVNVGFSENVFYSVAPLRTKDHLALLKELEDLALKALGSPASR